MALTTLSSNNSPVVGYSKATSSFDYMQIYNKNSDTREREVRNT